MCENVCPNDNVLTTSLELAWGWRGGMGQYYVWVLGLYKLSWPANGSLGCNIYFSVFPSGNRSPDLVDTWADSV